MAQVSKEHWGQLFEALTQLLVDQVLHLALVHHVATTDCEQSGTHQQL
jgi:hypothetical protein